MGCCGQGTNWNKKAVEPKVESIVYQAQSRTDIQRRRLLACRDCEHLTRQNKALGIGDDVHKLDRCSKCGCFVRAKALLKSASCPLEKWGI